MPYLPLVYDELRKLAAEKMAQNERHHLLGEINPWPEAAHQFRRLVMLGSCERGPGTVAAEPDFPPETSADKD